MNVFIHTANHMGDAFLQFARSMLWQSSVLIAVVFVLDLCFARKMRASIRYALWLAVLIKLILPPTLALPTSPMWWLQKNKPVAVNRQVTHFTIAYGDLQPLPKNPLPVAAPPKLQLKSSAWILMSAAIVEMALLFWLLWHWLWISRQMRYNKDSARLTASAIQTGQRAGIKFKSNPQVKLTDNAASPAVCGLFRPVVLIPQSLAEKFADEQLRVVLLHEMFHLRRGDVWVNCAQALLQIFYWWHPLLWLANARIRRVREEAVDDAVMLALGKNSEIYAPTLLEVAKFAFRRPLASLGLVGILESRSALRQRVERLMSFSAPRRAGLTFASICGILTFSAIALPMGEAPAKPHNSQNGNVVAATNAAPVDEEKLVRDGKLLYEMGKLNEAEAKFKTAITADPDNQRAQYYLELIRSARSLPKTIHYGTAGRRAIVEQLNRIRFDHFGPFNGTPLSAVIQQLNEAAKSSGANFSVLISPTLNGNSIAIQMPVMLKNETLGNVLDAVIISANSIKYSIMDDAIVFSIHTNNAAQLYSRHFKLNAEETALNLQRRYGQPVKTNELAKFFYNIFTNAGINLSPPKALFFNDRSGGLFVRATEADLDKIEREIEEIVSPLPQIHVKARVFEISDDMLRQIQAIVGTTNSVQVLTADNAATALWMLQKSDVEMLGAPEVTTLSGRQLRMRLTTSHTIITNFDFREIVTNVAGVNVTNSSVSPQTSTVESGSVLESVPTILDNNHTIDLKLTAAQTEFFGYADIPKNIAKRWITNSAFEKPIVWPAVEVIKKFARVNLYDGQTLVLLLDESEQLPLGTFDEKREAVVAKDIRDAKRKNGDKEVVAFVTPTLIDAAGHPIHSGDKK